jgi:hypothetical protein
MSKSTYGIIGSEAIFVKYLKEQRLGFVDIHRIQFKFLVPQSKKVYNDADRNLTDVKNSSQFLSLLWYSFQGHLQRNKDR